MFAFPGILGSATNVEIILNLNLNLCRYQMLLMVLCSNYLSCAVHYR
jgi:hypothetical protein